MPGRWKSSSESGPLRLLLLLGLLLLLLACWFYLQQQSIEQEKQHMQQRMNQLLHAQTVMRQRLARNAALLRQQEKRFQSLQKSLPADPVLSVAIARELALRQTVIALRLEQGEPDAAWLLAEAEYLWGLGGRALQEAGDTVLAARAFGQAARCLMATRQPLWQRRAGSIRRYIQALSSEDVESSGFVPWTQWTARAGRP